MDPVIKKQWINALRSGEFRQGTAVLHRESPGNEPDQFCCLGVLCDLAYRAGVVDRQLISHDGWAYSYGKERTHSMLPAEVLTWAKLDVGVSDPTVWVPNEHLPEIYRIEGEAGQEWCLSNANDRYIPFSTIAGLIQKSL